MNELERTAELSDLERVIEKGLDTFIEVGQALMRIRDERLYREAGYKSFESYCQERWGHRRAWADRQITAMRKVTELDPTGSTPENEWQARQLGASSPDDGFPAVFQALQNLRESHWRLAELANEVAEEYGEEKLSEYAREIVLDLEDVLAYREAWVIFGADGAPSRAFDRYIERALYGYANEVAS